jgi:hypothetical protein
MQARALLDVLAERRPHELRTAWAEAFARGKTWQRLMGEGLGLLPSRTRDMVLLTVGASRSVVPDLDLRFIPERAGYDASTDVVRFFALSTGPFAFAGRESVACDISLDALSVIAGGLSADRETALATFRQHRDRIEQAARIKYLTQPVGAVGEVRVTRADLASRTLAA